MILEFFCFLFLFCFFYDKKNGVSHCIATSLIFSIFLSEISLIISGSFIKITIWNYLIIKLLLLGFIFAYLYCVKRKRFLTPQDIEILGRLKYFDSVALISIIFIFLLIFFTSIGRYPVLWDSYSYHLPIAAHFIKHGIFSLYDYYGVPVGSYYPHFVELLYTPYLSSIGIEGSSIINFPSVVLIFVLIDLISSKLFCVKPTLSKIGAILFILLPLISNYYFESYVDLYFLGGVLGAYYFLERIDHLDKLNILMFFMSIGLCLGIKTQGIYVAITFLLFFLRKAFSHKKFLRIIIKMGPALILILMFCLIFYIRNYIQTGNPLFPIKQDLFGILYFPGVYELGILLLNTSILFNFSQIKRDVIYIVIKELSVGLFFLLIVWMSMLYGIITKKIKFPKELRNLMFLSGLFFFFYLFTPYTAIDTGGGPNFSLRLGIVFVGFLFLSTIIMSSFIIDKFIKIIILCLGIAQFCLVLNLFKIINVLFALFFTLIIFYILSLHKQKIMMYTLIGLVTLIIFIGLKFLPLPRMKWENYFYDIKRLETVNIAYAGTNRHFQLYDNELKYNVIYIKVNRDQREQKWSAEDWSYHKYNGNVLIWLKNLREAKISYFVLYDSRKKFIESQWIKAYPMIFQKEIANIYRINQDELEKFIKNYSKKPN